MIIQNKKGQNGTDKSLIVVIAIIMFFAFSDKISSSINQLLSYLF
ncbi:hypothetical protein [Texcoconibacillus texcoconensis]|uniref:Uncharacterized protein n=1 Tax=Texcoconibacillus texcoconensis TaxID=1095777 RepID=A0A840QIV0_9BACI|nr:hypothetical protein [Texcoconibacillus texcoconensis]MBB5171898.1 hypothetical protein [Texcoconibacillus texcoconensis]